MNTEDAPLNIQLVTIDELFNAFNGNRMWLEGCIKRFIEDEDAELIDAAPSWIYEYLNDDDFYVELRSKSSGFGNRIKISFSAYGFRRGVLLMDEMLPDFPKQESGLSNWYLGFTVAGNGTPAFIFPVNDDIARIFAGEVLRKALL